MSGPIKDLLSASGPAEETAAPPAPEKWSRIVGELAEDSEYGVEYSDKRVRSRVGGRVFTFNKTNKNGEQTIVSSALGAAISEQLQVFGAGITNDMATLATGISKLETSCEENLEVAKSSDGSLHAITNEVTRLGLELVELKSEVQELSVATKQCLAILELLKSRPIMSEAPKPSMSSGNKEGKAKAEPTALGGGGPGPSKGAAPASEEGALSFADKLAALRAKGTPRKEE